MPVKHALELALALLVSANAPAAATPRTQADAPEGSEGASDATTEEPTTLAPMIIEVQPNARHARWYGRAGIGFAYRWGFDESMIGAALDGELGAQNHRMAGGVRLHLEAGKMLAGLPFQVVTFGPMMWLFAAPRVRVGFGIDAGALLITRRTVPGRSMWTVMLGGHVDGSFDLLKVGAAGTLQLDASVGAYALTQAPGPISMMTTIGVGYRP